MFDFTLRTYSYRLALTKIVFLSMQKLFDQVKKDLFALKRLQSDREIRNFLIMDNDDDLKMIKKEL